MKIDSYLSCRVGRAHCESHTAVDQEATRFDQSEFQYPIIYNERHPNNKDRAARK